MKHVRRILLYVLFGALTTLLTAATAACLFTPYASVSSSGQHFHVFLKEPEAARVSFSKRSSGWITTTRATLGDTRYGQSWNPDIIYNHQLQLEKWCTEALLPWSSGTRPWPSFVRDGHDWMMTVEVGWPMRALSFEAAPERAIRPDETTEPPLVIRQGIELSNNDLNFRALPYGPLWPGLIINTAFFAAAWFALVLSATTLRRAFRNHRIRRNRCPKCGYSREGLTAPTCPECGTLATNTISQ